MNFLKSIYKEGDILLFYAYIWQIPFAWRFIIVPNRGTGSNFNEYMDISLYIGEIILLLAYILKRHKENEKSIKFRIYISRLFHVKQLVLFFAGNFILFNILLSIDPLLSFVSTIHFVFVFLAAHMLYGYFVSRGTKVLIEIGNIFLISLAFQLYVASYQVYAGHSIGLSWLSESVLQIEKSGIAKSNIFGELVLRGYGTFPHPNVFSAYSMFVLIYILYLSKLFHVKRELFLIVISISLLSVIVAQSKLSIFLIVLIIAFNTEKMFHVELGKTKLKVTLLLIILGIVLYVFQSDVGKSLSTRMDQLFLQNKHLSISPIGTGIGTYRLTYDLIDSNNNWWLLEPVHNILYIFVNEMGVLGAISILVILIWIHKVVPRETFKELQYLILFLFLVLMTDHYGWDIYQGQQIIGLIVILIFIYYRYLTKAYKYSNKRLQI